MNEVNKGGRPPKYPYDLLLKELKQYTQKNPMGKITNAVLSKATKIPPYVWRDNKKIQGNICKLNNAPISIGELPNDMLELSNIIELVEQNYGSKKGLIQKLRMYMDYTEALYIKAIKAENLEKEIGDLKLRLKKSQEQNKELKVSNDIYNNQLKELAVKSISLKNRKELGIKNNVLSINENRGKAGATIKDINKKFPDLFK